MTKLLTASLSSKSQLTLPKEVRSLLGVKAKGDSIGFVVDTEAGTVRLARVEPVVMDAEFTEEEFRKIAKFRGSKGGKTFKSAGALLKDLKS